MKNLWNGYIVGVENIKKNKMTSEILSEKPHIEIYLGNCLKVMKQIPDKSIDLILTDPPYPDCHKEEYQYRDGILDFLKDLHCRQFIFWTAKKSLFFPLDWTAIHIWDKLMGVASMYELIFERNGQKAYRIFHHCPIQNKICAQMKREIFTGHPSQKPKALIVELLNKYTKKSDTILDSFMGSGTTLVAAKELGRNAIGIEIEPKYYEIAKRRINNTTTNLL